MRFKHCIEEIKEEFYYFEEVLKATAHSSLNTEVVKEIWNGYCYTASHLEVELSDKCVFSVGKVPVPDLDGYSYAIEVSSEGIAISATDEQHLMYGFFDLLAYIEPVNLEVGKEKFRIPYLSVKDRPAIQNRMVHMCVFPETSEDFIRKFIKLCGVLKYNYLVVEFWGMLQFDCLKELGWNCALTKEQAGSFVKLANDLGMEVIPMLNHFGHASSCRVSSGKHVVLDQNPRLQSLFNSTGWVWNIQKQEVRELMRQARKELMELCGEGKYFHIGCDEAYGYENMSTEEVNLLLEYVREIADDLESYGRRPIMWGDMLLYNRYIGGDTYACCCHDEKTEQLLLNNMDKRIIIADWQYEVKNYPIATSVFFKEHGFDVLCCPWDRTTANISVATETIKNHSLMGIMHTTWHTLQEPFHGMPFAYYAAVLSWYQNVPHVAMELDTATILRKIHSADGDYEKTGFMPRQVSEFAG